jgi:hypothetical protein
MNPIMKIENIITNWLERKYQKRAFQQAVSRAHSIFAQRYPEWVASHFDEYFLAHDAAFLLLRIGQGVASPKPFNLAYVWSYQMPWLEEETRQKMVAELTPIASDFLRLLEAELCIREPVNQPAGRSSGLIQLSQTRCKQQAIAIQNNVHRFGISIR